ncbi:heterokaryon incompatibility protein-domain-containing protein, partial [Hyaloscypha finlandica]
VYTPIKENEFRIVTIQPGSDDDPIRCNLSVVEDDHVPEYQALSYVWGSQKDSKTIHLNDTPWQITTNLFAALKQLREADGPHAMWIDALAINQTDIAERNAQVSKMRTMYSLAESTVIWLGPMDDD